MADSTTQLDRIAKLVDQITPVGNKQHGMRIESGDWNTLVDVALGILQLDRLQELRTENLLEQRFALKDHVHLGEVSIAWLDADLQSRLGGATAAVSTRQALADMDQKIRALSAEVTRLQTVVANSQKVMDDTQVKEIDRSKALLDFDRRFKGIEDMKTLVSTLSSDVGSIRTNVDTVLELRKSLQDAAGNVIDVGQIRTDVESLKLLGANFNGADGKPIRLRDVESQLADIANVVGTAGAGGLDGRFATVSASIQEAVNAKTLTLMTDAQTTRRNEAAGSETRLRNEFQTSLDQSRDSLQQQFTSQLANTETKFNAALDIRIGGLTEDVRKDALTNTGALLNQRLADMPGQISAQVASAVNSLQGTLSTSLQATLTATVSAQVKDAETRLNQQINGIQASTAALTQSLPGQVANQIAGALPGLQSTLTQKITEQVAAVRQGIEAAVGTTVNTSVASALQTLDTRIATAVSQQTASIGGKVTDAVNAATKDLPAQVATEVKTQLTAVNLDGKLQDSTKAVTTQLRSEIKSAIADQDARTSAAVQGAVTLLQGQLASAVANGVKDAKDFAKAQTNSLRTEVNATIDSKLKNTRDALVTDFNSRLQVNHDQITADFQTQIRTVNDNLIRRFQPRTGGIDTTDGLIR